MNKMNSQCGGITPAGSWMDKLESSLIKGHIDRRSFVRLAACLGLGGASVLAAADALDDIRANQGQRILNLLPAYDYIICGTGSAGCALAGRLAKDPKLNILLIEAGDWDTAPAVLDPRLWFTNLGTERDWGDVATSSVGVNNRAIAEHMGRVVGGGSSINATIWVRPFKNDLEHWADVSGDKAWGYAHALNIYQRMENWQGAPNSKYRGQGGNVWCEPSQNPLPIAPAMLEGARSLGLPVLDDLNGAREEGEGGFALMNHIIKEGRRFNMARAYLYPVLHQKNITLLTNTHLERLSFRGQTVTGVEVMRNGSLLKIGANNEVILSTGGINTPKVLLLSGIGDEKQLAQHGIKTIVHAPEVGRNFQDQLLHGGCLWEPPVGMEHRNSGAEASGFWKSRSDLATPDMNIVQIELPYTSDVVTAQYKPPATSWALCAGLVGPKSRGEVRLRSRNPSDRPIVDANFLSHPDDVKSMQVGIELCREIGNSKAMSPWVKREVIPGKKLTGDDLTQFVRNGATTFFHQSGTCRMGKDDQAVVDAQLRVNGVQRLRIADSSIMPRIVSCATMASCVLIGERMAELLNTSRG